MVWIFFLIFAKYSITNQYLYETKNIFINRTIVSAQLDGSREGPYRGAEQWSDGMFLPTGETRANDGRCATEHSHCHSTNQLSAL